MDGPEDHRPKRAKAWGSGILVSVLLHVVLAFALFFHFPMDLPEPQKEESVAVEIVPPPEETEEKPQEEEQAPAPEEAKKEEPLPPPPPPPQEEKAEQPPPEAPPQQTAETPPPNEQAGGQTMPALRPVQQFAEKDAGPRKAEDGDAPEEPATPPAEQQPKDHAAKAADKASEQDAPAEEAAGTAVPDDIELPQVDVAALTPQSKGGASNAEPVETATEIVPAPAPKPEPPKEQRPALTKATKLFSRAITESEIATTAMGDIPRGVRAGQLCATELREQLRHAPAAFRSDVLPAYKLPSGTVLDIKRAAFRASGQWYNISFRCEVDGDATKVVSFAFDIGSAVPRSEWRARGFPN